MLATTESLPLDFRDILLPTADRDGLTALQSATDHSDCLFFPSARTALRYALVDAGLDEDDEVLLPAYSCYAVQQAVEDVATPRYVDVTDSYTVDPADIAERISPSTAAIVPTHLYGIECDMAAVASLADDHDLLILEDAAQAVSNLLLSDGVGTMSDYTFVSFRFYKEVTAFKGGLLLSSDLPSRVREHESRSKRARLATVWLLDAALRWLPGSVYQPLRERVLDPMARSKSGTLNEADPREPSEWTTRILSEQLSQLRSRVEVRRDHAAVYETLLPDPFDCPPVEEPNTVFRYPVRVPRARDALQRELRQRGIGVSPMYSYTLAPEGACPTSERLADSVLNLPVHSGLTREDIESIASTVDDAWRSLR